MQKSEEKYFTNLQAHYFNCMVTPTVVYSLDSIDQRKRNNLTSIIRSIF